MKENGRDILAHNAQEARFSRWKPGTEKHQFKAAAVQTAEIMRHPNPQELLGETIEALMQKRPSSIEEMLTGIDRIGKVISANIRRQGDAYSKGAGKPFYIGLEKAVNIKGSTGKESSHFLHVREMEAGEFEMVQTGQRISVAKWKPVGGSIHIDISKDRLDHDKVFALELKPSVLQGKGSVAYTYVPFFIKDSINNGLGMEKKFEEKASYERDDLNSFLVRLLQAGKFLHIALSVPNFRKK